MSGASNLAAVLDATRDFVRRFVVMSDHQAVVFTLWVFHTHAFGAADYTPYLWVKSAERESGKSRLKEIAELLVANPQKTANITPPAVFRLAGEPPTPTFLIDELDEIFSPKSERSELRGLLNAGFRRGEKATRMVGEGSKHASQALQRLLPEAPRREDDRRARRHARVALYPHRTTAEAPVGEGRPLPTPRGRG